MEQRSIGTDVKINRVNCRTFLENLGNYMDSWNESCEGSGYKGSAIEPAFAKKNWTMMATKSEDERAPRHCSSSS